MITITFDPQGGLPAPLPQEVDIGGKVICPDTPEKTGYSFTEWQRDGAAYDFDYEITENDADFTLTAIYSLVTYTATYNLDGGSASNPATFTAPDLPIALQAPAKPYTESGAWYKDSGRTEPITEITEAADITLFAGYVYTQYNITYNLNGGAQNPANPATFTAPDLPIAMKAPARLDYDFTGWFADSEFTEPVTDIHNIGNKTLYAKWALHRYYINYYLDGGINDPSNPARFSILDLPLLTMEPAEKDYFTFDNWYLDADFVTPFDGIETGTHVDVDLYAKFTAIPYPINYELNGGTNNPNNPQQYTVNSPDIVLQNASRNGFVFSGWFLDNTYAQQIDSIITCSHGEITLYAKWTAINYPILYEGVYNGTHENPGAYIILDNVVFSDAHRDGYTFEGWYKDSGRTERIYEIAAGSTGEVVLYAKWALITYTVSYALNGGTQNPANITQYNIETPLFELREPSRPGYAFQGWYRNSDLTGEPCVSIAGGEFGNTGLFAKWNINVYPIVYELNGQGVNNPLNPAQYTYDDDDIEIRQPILSSYWGYWYDNPEFTGERVNQIPHNSTGPVTLYCKWEVAVYNISYNTEGGRNDPNNPANYTALTPLTELLPAVRVGCEFAGWFPNIAHSGAPKTEIGGGELGNLELYAYWITPFSPNAPYPEKDIYEGDPRISISPAGADLTYVNGNPLMTKGLHNEALISLFTKENWWGSVFFENGLGSNFQDLCSGDISVQKLALIENAALLALMSNRISKTDISASNPQGDIVKINVNITSTEKLTFETDSETVKTEE